MSTYTLSIDPGVRNCGCALWLEGELISAKLVRGSKNACIPGAAIVMANAVREWVYQHISIFNRIVPIIEMPRTYGGRSAKGSTNDLLSLATVVGALACEFHNTVLVEAPEWKGGVPKKSKIGTNPIKERCKDELSKDEWSLVELPSRSLEHNVFDSIWIGITYLRKLGERP